MFNELFERVFRINENEKTIRTIYKIYKDFERGLDPEVGDLAIALEGLEDYYVDYIEWWVHGYGKDEPKNLKNAYRDRYEEIVNALSTDDRQSKIVALDNAINQWHIDFPVIAHLTMESDDTEMEQLASDTAEILRRLGRLPDTSPYKRN